MPLFYNISQLEVRGQSVFIRFANRDDMAEVFHEPEQASG